MPVTPDDIRMLLSRPDAARGHVVGGRPNDALGGFATTTELDREHGDENLFADITGAQNEAEATHYRCVFVYNRHPSLPLLSTRVLVTQLVADGAGIAVGADPTDATPVDSFHPQALVIRGETEAPVDVVFDSEANLRTIPARHVRGVWVRRQAPGRGPMLDGALVRVEGDTPP